MGVATVDRAPATAGAISARCSNCEAELVGPYCAQCGQHAHDSARSIGVLFNDAWHVVTHVDSRLWSTLWLLLARPAALTSEYFRDHRARYLPPIRLYLVLSLAFFALAGLSGLIGPRHLRDSPERTAEKRAEAARELDAARAQVTDPEAQRALAEADAALKKVPAGGASSDKIGFDPKACDDMHSDVKAFEQPFKNLCRITAADGGQTLLREFFRNFPKMMFVFLPLIALVMWPMYWFPRRLYVEHLVFFVHTHAAFFLALTIALLLGMVGRHIPGLHWLGPVTGFVVVPLYALWYVYRAMRRYYGQGRTLTLLKYAVLGFAYFVCLLITVLGTVVVSAYEA